MTLMRHLTNKRALRAVLPLAGLGIAAGALSGCGGASTSVGGVSAPTLQSGPVVYGVNNAAATGGIQSFELGETSGLAFNATAGGTTMTEGALIAATGYRTTAGAGPLPAYQINFPNANTTPPSSPGLALGFAPTDFSAGGAYIQSSAPVAALPTTYTGTLTFGAYVSTGTFNSRPSDLNTSSIVLTSSEAPTFSQQLAFDPNFNTDSPILTSAQYRSAPFPIPSFLQTTGLHNLHTTVADVNAQSSSTDFSVLALAPTDSAALISIQFSEGGGSFTAVPGATATITNALPTVAAYQDSAAPTGAAALPKTTSYSDLFGSVLLFAPPGPQTVTITGLSPIDGKTVVTGTVQLTLVAGQVDTTHSITATATTATASAAATARYKQLYHLK